MVLLDTCAVIWLAEQLPMTAQSLVAIQQPAIDDDLLISPVSALGSRHPRDPPCELAPVHVHTAGGV